METMALSVVGWNALRIPWGEVPSVIDEIRTRYGNSIICLQEVAWRCETELMNWVVVHQTDCPSAMLIPRPFSSSLRWQLCLGCCAAAVVGTVLIISAYISNSWKPLELFHKCVEDIRSVTRQAYANTDITSMIISSDTNTQLPCVLPLTGPQAVGKYTTSAAYNERTDTWLSLMSELGMMAVNTWSCNPGRQYWLTRVPFGTDRRFGL